MVSKQYCLIPIWLTYCILCILVFCCLLSLSIRADELKITPNTCATTLKSSTCNLDIIIEYLSPNKESMCIWIVKHSAAIACFKDSFGFKYQIQLTLAEDTLFELRNMNSNDIVATTLVKVAKFEPANTRRRRGLNWNLL